MAYVPRGISPCGQPSNLLNDYFPIAEVMHHYLGNTRWYTNDLLQLGVINNVECCISNKTSCDGCNVSGKGLLCRRSSE